MFKTVSDIRLAADLCVDRFGLSTVYYAPERAVDDDTGVDVGMELASLLRAIDLNHGSRDCLCWSGNEGDEDPTCQAAARLAYLLLRESQK